MAEHGLRSRGMNAEQRTGLRVGLLARIVAAIVAGILFGMVLPAPVIRVFTTFNGLFSQFLSFVIPLIIVGLIAPAIGELGRGAGKLLGLTAGIAYASTVFAGMMGLGASLVVLPRLLVSNPGELADPSKGLLEPFFTIKIPQLFGEMSALVLAFIMGLGMTVLKGDALRRGFDEVREVINLVITKVIVPLLPLYILGIFLNMTHSGQAFTIMVTFLGVVIFVFLLTWIMLALQYGTAGLICGRNPVRMLVAMLPAYVTALGTSSSAATIPVTLRQSIRSGTSTPVASFVIPLCATIHLAGSTIKITCFALAVMMLFGMPIKVLTMVGFVCLLGVLMVAAPGVPGGAIVTASALLSSMLGFTEAQVGLMVATYIAIDSFGTATNVTGDGAIVDRVAGRLSHRTGVTQR